MKIPSKRTTQRNITHYTILSGIMLASYPFQLYYRYTKEPIHPMGIVVYSVWFLFLIYCLIGVGVNAGIFAFYMKDEEK